MTILERGARVMTTEDACRNDWQTERKCRWGVNGIVLRHSDSHGLCYLVMHLDDGTECWYDHDEVRRNS